MLSDDFEEPRSRGSLEFVESSILSTVVPNASNIDITKALQTALENFDQTESSPLSSIEQRSLLFFG